MDNKNHREMAKIIHKSSKRLNETLNSILDLSKIESQKLDLRFNRIDLVSMIQECKYAFSDAINRKGLKFSVSNEYEKVIINSDMNIIHKILYNIIDNSVKYTNEGEITVALIDNEDNAIIKVTDTGIGIPEENLSQIFEPFRQGSEGLNRKFEGMGLGLTITRKYIELLGGKLNIESKHGNGTVIEMTLPKNL
jgi:signal transduction histidine kinase